MRRAFTLIELLVVIAIIAILAAILFPVFAQAKEAAKKTASISNVKQSGTAMAVYTADSDDTYPSAGSIDDGRGLCGGTTPGVLFNGWVDSWWTTVPAGADPVDYNPEACGQIDGVAWINSTQNYRKSYEITTLAGKTAEDWYDADTMKAYTKPPATVNFNFNGLLHFWSASAIAQPSKLTVIWPIGDVNIRGAYPPSNPILNCGSTGAPCQFNPNGYPATDNDGSGFGDFDYGFSDAPYGSFWNYSKGSVFSMADTSAHFYKQGSSNPKEITYQSPFTNFDSKGVAASAVYCRTTTTAPYYDSFFRPDSEFTYELKTRGKCTP